MITVRPDSRVYLLLTLLSYVGEFPLSSIHLLGSKEAWRKLIHQLSIQQTFRFPDMSERISCKLLLINGELDDNVDPTSTLQVVDALMKANKNFDQLYLPGRTHSLGATFEIHKMYDYFVEHLLGQPAPEWE